MDTMATQTLESLPNEVLDNISLLLAKNNVDYAKSFRLVNRRFAGIVTRHIFGTLLLRQHPDKWANLNKIAAVPHLAAWVKTIRVAHVPQPTIYKTRQEWCKDVKELLNARHVSFDENDLRKAWEEHSYWKKGHLTILQWYCKSWYYDSYTQHGCSNAVPEMHLDKFPHLTTLETISWRELQHRLNELYVREPPYTRPELEVLCREVNFQESVKQGEWKDYNENHLMMLAARQRNGKKIPNMKISDIKEILEDVNHPDRNLPSIDARCVETLTIDLRKRIYQIDRVDAYTQATLNQADRFANSWLSTMTALQDLTIIENPAFVIGMDTLKLLGHLHFPRLRTLRLHEITTSKAELWLFFRMHRDSLRLITIEDLSMDHHDWQTLRQSILKEHQIDDLPPRDQTKLIMTIHSRNCLNCPDQPLKERSSR